MSRSREDLPEGIYVELVREVYATLLPTAIIAVSFLGVGTLIGLGMLARTARIVNLLLNRARAAA